MLEYKFLAIEKQWQTRQTNAWNQSCYCAWQKPGGIPTRVPVQQRVKPFRNIMAAI